MNNLIIAIGDLHGHYRALERILDAVQKKYGIFGAGGEDRLRPGVQFVFTGDYIDRGRHALRIIDRLRRLADREPGPGRHPARQPRTDGARSLRRGCGVAAALRRRQFQGPGGGLRQTHRPRRNGGTQFIREFGDTSLPAFESYVARMARTGDIGQWMRMLLPAYRTRIAGRGVLFMHADLPAEYRDRDGPRRPSAVD